MKNILRIGLVAALFAASCTTDLTSTLPEEGFEGAVGATKSIVFDIDNSKTRVHTGSQSGSYMPLYWSAGDQLVVNGTLSSVAVADEYDGKASAVIDVPADATYPMTFIYPNAVGDNSDAHFLIPAEQDYDPTRLANGYAVMFGYAAAEGSKVTMQHMCGYVSVSLTGTATVKKVMLRTVGHEPISGFFCPTFDANGHSMDCYATKALADGYYHSPVITINCGDDGVELSSTPTEFCFALPAADYSKGFELTVLDSNNKQQTATAYSAGKEVEAGVMTKTTLAVNCTKDAGIHTLEQFAGYVRTLEKDCWLDNNDALTLHTDLDLKNLDRTGIDKFSSLINFRSDYNKYNNSGLKTFEGNNKKILNYKSTVTHNASGAIFNIILAGTTVQNLTIGSTAGENADCVFTFKASNTNDTSYSYNGVLSSTVQGTIKNCTNNATANYVFTSGCGPRFGVFCSNGDNVVFTAENCTNNGNIFYTEAKSISAGKILHLGGIASRIAASSVVKNCVNNGAISVTPKDVVAADYEAANKIPAFKVGGITGETYVDISSNTNNGKITFKAKGVRYVHVGGIVATTTANITDCTNSGSIDVVVTGNNDIVRVAGIVASYKDGKTIDNCHTTATATISMSTDYTGTGWNAVGGIVGYGSAENTSPSKIKNSTNRATIVYGGTALARIGGITGQTGDITNCTNYGAVKQTNTECAKDVYAGGIGGSMHYNYSGINNYGDVTVSSDSCFAGGFAGYTTGTAAKTYSECNADCTVTATKDGNGGIFFGYIASAAITLTDCKAYGKVVLAGAETAVLSSNIADLCFGSATEDNTIDVTGVTVESTK